MPFLCFGSYLDPPGRSIGHGGKGGKRKRDQKDAIPDAG